MLDTFKNKLIENGEVYIRVKVQASAPKSEYVEAFTDSEGEECLKVKIRAVPERGKANKELIQFLAKKLDIPKKNITIIAGEKNTLKLIKIVA